MKYAHNYLSFPFTLGVILIFLIWIGGNIPNRVDAEWLKRGGGIVGHDRPPAYRFNAGQKMIYWIVVLGGAAVAISGYVLMFPFYGTDIQSMQAAQIAHGVVAMLSRQGGSGARRTWRRRLRVRVALAGLAEQHAGQEGGLLGVGRTLGRVSDPRDCQLHELLGRGRPEYR